MPSLRLVRGATPQGRPTAAGRQAAPLASYRWPSPPAAPFPLTLPCPCRDCPPSAPRLPCLLQPVRADGAERGHGQGAADPGATAARAGDPVARGGRFRALPPLAVGASTHLRQRLLRGGSQLQRARALPPGTSGRGDPPPRHHWVAPSCPILCPILTPDPRLLPQQDARRGHQLVGSQPPPSPPPSHSLRWTPTAGACTAVRGWGGRAGWWGGGRVGRWNGVVLGKPLAGLGSLHWQG